MGGGSGGGFTGYPDTDHGISPMVPGKERGRASPPDKKKAGPRGPALKYLAIAALSHALDDERRRDRALRRETVGVLEVIQGLLELRLVVVVDHHQRLALLDLRADLLDLRDADGVVDLVVVRGVLAGAEERDALGDHGRVDGVHIAALRGGQLADVAGRREFLRMVDEGRVAALGADHVLELLQRGAVGQVALHGLL